MAGEPLDPSHHRAHRRQVDLVVTTLQDMVGCAQPGAAVRAHAGLGDKGLVGLGTQRPAAAFAPHAARPWPGALALGRPVGLAIRRWRLAGIVRILRRLAQLRLERRDARLQNRDQTHQVLNTPGQGPQVQDQAILLGFAQCAQVRWRDHVHINRRNPRRFNPSQRSSWRGNPSQKSPSKPPGLSSYSEIDLCETGVQP
jgi:hypothetical protein